MLRKTKEKLYPKVLDNYRGSRDLGFSFTNSVTKKKKARFPDYKYFPVVHRKKRTKLKEKLRALTDRRAIGGIDAVKAKLRLALKGWSNYFKKAVSVWWRIKTDSW